MNNDVGAQACLVLNAGQARLAVGENTPNLAARSSGLEWRG